MRGLGLCVSVEHAHWMARKFVTAIRAELVELFELLLERTDHLVGPLNWGRADPPPFL